MSREPLVGISEACQIVGVSETALRQWTDEGKIKAFVTPGGHRRYLVAELKKFTASRHKAIGIKDLAAELEDTARIHREIAMRFLPTISLYSRLTIESKGELAELGRHMLNLIIKYIIMPSEQESTLKLLRDVGKGFGLTLAKLELPLTDSVEAFIMHRDPILGAITCLLKKRGTFSGRIVDAIPLVTNAMDEAMVTLVATHQQYRNGIQNESGREIAQ